MSKRIPLALAIALIFLFSALTVILTVSVYLRTYTKSLINFGEQAKQFSTLTEIEDVEQLSMSCEISFPAASSST